MARTATAGGTSTGKSKGASTGKSRVARAKPALPSEGALESTRERILGVAEELIALHGMEGFQLKDVAERIGIRPPSIFAHFRGRDAIGEAVAIRVVEQLGVLLSAEMGAVEEPEQKVRRAVRAVVTHLDAHPAHVRLLLRDLAQAGSGDAFEHVGRITHRIEAEIDDVLAQGRADGTFRKVSGRAMLAQVEGAILANIAWSGWNESGRPRTPRTLTQIQRDAEELAIAYVLAANDETRL